MGQGKLAQASQMLAWAMKFPENGNVTLFLVVFVPRSDNQTSIQVIPRPCVATGAKHRNLVSNDQTSKVDNEIITPG